MPFTLSPPNSGYGMAYEGPILMLLGKDQRRKVDEGIHVGVLNTFEAKRKSKEKKFKNFFENDIRTQTNAHKCSLCELWGHHKITYKISFGLQTSQISQVESDCVQKATAFPRMAHYDQFRKTGESCYSLHPYREF